MHDMHTYTYRTDTDDCLAVLSAVYHKLISHLRLTAVWADVPAQQGETGAAS